MYLQWKLFVYFDEENCFNEPIFFFLLLSAATLMAAPIHPLGDGDAPGTFGTNDVQNSTRGWRFLVNVDIEVVELGASTPHPSGSAFSVALWQVSGASKLAQLDFISDGSDNWQWAPLSIPLNLTAGNEYIVSQYSTEGWYYYGSISNPGPWAPTGAVQYLDMRFANGATPDTFPTAVLSNYQYGVPDFGYNLASASAVPEPSSLFLLSMGMSAVFALRRRRANKAVK